MCFVCFFLHVSRMFFSTQEKWAMNMLFASMNSHNLFLSMDHEMPHRDLQTIKMSFVIEFAHMTCSNCNLNCYVYNAHGPKAKWMIWHPSQQDIDEKATHPQAHN